jgi:hypothetical protein
LESCPGCTLLGCEVVVHRNVKAPPEVLGFLVSGMFVCSGVEPDENRTSTRSTSNKLPKPSCLMNLAVEKGLNFVEGFFPHALLHPKKDGVRRAKLSLQSV